MKNRRLLFSSSIVLFLFFSVKSVAGPPFRTDDPQPVDFQHWEFYIASMQQFDHQGTSVTAPHFEINYGIIQDCTASSCRSTGICTHYAGNTLWIL